MTTRKRVGGGFKIIHPKELSPEVKTISPDVENLKEHHFNSEKETRKDDVVTYEHIDLDIKSDRDDSSDHQSVKLPEINERGQRLPDIFKKHEKHEKEKLELPVISPDKILPQVTISDKFSSLVTSDDKFSSLVTISGKFSSLVTSREDTEKTDSSTEKLKVCLKIFSFYHTGLIVGQVQMCSLMKLIYQHSRRRDRKLMRRCRRHRLI